MKSRSLSITGATGFVGWHVAEAFVQRGWRVRAVVRRGNQRPLPQGVEAVESDLDVASLTRAFDGSDAVIHGAALIRAKDEAAFHLVNVVGARAAADAAKHVDARFVLISSLAAGGEGTVERPRHEDDPPAPVNAYGRSKLASERAVQEVDGLRWTIIRPCAVYGPRDYGFLPLFRMARRGLFLVPSGRDIAYTLVYIGDLVDAIVRATEVDGAVGQTCFIGHQRPHTGDDLLRVMAQVEGRTFRPIRVPGPLFTAVARLGDVAWQLGIKPMVDSGRLVELRAKGFVCRVDRAEQVLGFTATMDLEAGVAATARWYREHGWT